MIDLKTVKEIRISEGSVTKITNSSGVVLWEAKSSNAAKDVYLITDTANTFSLDSTVEKYNLTDKKFYVDYKTTISKDYEATFDASGSTLFYSKAEIEKVKDKLASNQICYSITDQKSFRVKNGSVVESDIHLSPFINNYISYGKYVDEYTKVSFTKHATLTELTKYENGVLKSIDTFPKTQNAYVLVYIDKNEIDKDYIEEWGGYELFSLGKNGFKKTYHSEKTDGYFWANVLDNNFNNSSCTIFKYCYNNMLQRCFENPKQLPTNGFHVYAFTDYSFEKYNSSFPLPNFYVEPSNDFDYFVLEKPSAHYPSTTYQTTAGTQYNCVLPFNQGICKYSNDYYIMKNCTEYYLYTISVEEYKGSLNTSSSKLSNKKGTIDPTKTYYAIGGYFNENGKYVKLSNGIEYHPYSGNVNTSAITCADETEMNSLKYLYDGLVVHLSGTAKSYNCVYNSTTSQYEFNEFDEIKNDYSVNLTVKGNWITSTTNPDSSAYDAYMSNGSHNVNNGMDCMSITINGYTKFTVYIRSYGESNYDYTTISKLDTPYKGSSSQGSSQYSLSYVYAHTRGKSNGGTDIGSYTKVEYDNIDGGEHTIYVYYTKDGSGNNYDDRGYILIPKEQ